jgi:hypothetical protein
VPNEAKLPPEVIRQWPEVFKDVEVKAVPVKYIKAIQVQFLDGTIWLIDIDKEQIENNETTLEDELEAFFEEYDEQIDSIDFKLDTKQVITDVKKRTNKFIKKRK